MRRNRTTQVDREQVDREQVDREQVDREQVDTEGQLLDSSSQPVGMERSPVAAPPTPPSRQSSLLSRRILVWSGNLLATCVIVILGLTFGKQVLQWWRGDPPTVMAVNTDQDEQLIRIADPSLPHLLAFGDSPLTFDRRTFVGDEAGALAQLRTSCRELAIHFDARQQAAIPVSPQLLRRLEALPPVEQGVGWRIVQNGGPVITVVALRMNPGTTIDEANVASQFAKSVVSWGLGLRALETATTEEAASLVHWTLFTCSGRSQTVDSDLNLSLPIPPNCQRTLAVRVQDGGALLGFSGQGNASSSKRHFDDSFAQRGWQRTMGWTAIGTHWHARYQNATSDVCDIQIMGDADGETSGILTLTTAVQNSEN